MDSEITSLTTSDLARPFAVARVSFIWLSLLSSFENGAAIPPWAQQLEVLIPSEFLVITPPFL